MFKYDDFLARAHSRLLNEPPVGWNSSDDAMNERARLIPEGVAVRPAAVLIGIIQRDEPMVLLTRRQDHLEKHPGQVAFPGGRVDGGETVLQAALREAHEETGLSAEFVRPLGFSDGFLTISHYVVKPVVALIDAHCSFARDEGEVAEIFEVPLAFLMDVRNCQKQSREFQGWARYFYAYPFGERYIWGATAGMIRNLHDRLYA